MTTLQHETTVLLYFTTLFLLLTSATTGSSAAYPTSYGEESCGLSGGDNLIPEMRDTYGNGYIIDISHRIQPNMPSFMADGGLGQVIKLVASRRNGSLANFSEMKLPSHTGTHVDSPAHFYDEYLDAGFDVDTLDLYVLNGPVLLVDAPRNSNITGTVLTNKVVFTAEVMKSLHIPRGVGRVLFRTLNTDRRLMYKKDFDSSYVGFMEDGAQWLIDNTDIKLVGIDYLSAAAFDHVEASHLVFLKSREIILVEGLNLDDVPVGMYNVHCLPLRLIGAEGSPMRCILIK